VRSRFYTVMIIPDARSKVRTVLIRRGLVCIVLSCFLAAAVGVGLLVRSRLIGSKRIEEMTAEVAGLTAERVSAAQVSRLMQDVERMKQRVSEVGEKAGQIETMVGLEGEVGVGGPESSQLSGPFSRFYSTKQKELLTELSDELGMLDVTLDRQGARENLLASYLDEHKKLLGSIPSVTPVDGGWLSSAFGYRRDPFTHRSTFHSGVDLCAPRGTPIHVTANGVVTDVNWYSDWGYAVEVDHGNGFSTWYAHCSKVISKRGDRVERGEIISRVGATGRTTGPHLHYEVRVNGTAQNPIYYMLDRD